MRGHWLSGYEGFHSDKVAEDRLKRVVSVLAGVHWIHWIDWVHWDGVTLAAAFPSGTRRAPGLGLAPSRVECLTQDLL